LKTQFKESFARDLRHIRVGDYRIGVVLEDGVVTFVRVLHRRDVYRYFP
jgi:mRNA interferase RelE/StbE